MNSQRLMVQFVLTFCFPPFLLLYFYYKGSYIRKIDTSLLDAYGRFIVRKKLYEVQSTLTKDFIKISQSEIANVKYIHSLDLGLRGTIVINYKNSDISYVSRRMLKEFKMKLGL